MFKYEKYAVVVIFLIFAATLSPWAYNFPLNDDWAYAQAVKTFIETGRLVLSDWGASTQVLHIAIGAVFSKLFGFSFATLRVVNVLIAAGALFMFVKIMDEFEIDPLKKMAAGLTLALNPIYLVLANSFMTDIQYFFWMLAAVFFYIRRLNDPEDAAALAWAGGCVAAAYLTRQLAVGLPLAFTLSLFFKGRPKWRELALVWALPAAAILGYHLWFTTVNGPTWASENYVSAATLGHLSKPLGFLSDAFYRLFSSMLEIGLLLLPLAIGYMFSLPRASSRGGMPCRIRSAAPWLTFAALLVFALINGPLPYLENTMAHSGFGVLTLGGSYHKPSGLFASQGFWLVATGAAIISSIFLTCASGLALRTGSSALRFIFSVCFIQLAISLIGAKFFDRYLLTLLPWFAVSAVFAAREMRFNRPAVAAALIMYGCLGWIGVKDYFAWNSAKWELAGRPRADLQPGQIINGFDYEAWFNYEKKMASLKSMKPLSMIGEWEWQKSEDYKAIVTFNPDPRLRVLDKAEYSTPLSSRKGVLYLMIPRN